jgi:hypothetical protein
MATPPNLINSLTGYTNFEDHLFEQYKLMVDTSQKLSDRRLSTNSYLFTINSSLLTVFGALAAFLPDRRPLAIIPLAGLLLSISWMFLLKSFKLLNAAKFDVIHDLEQRLPARIFDMEWYYLNPGYKAMSDIERRIPMLFVALYAFLTIFIWFLPIKQDSPQLIKVESPVTVQMASPGK